MDSRYSRNIPALTQQECDLLRHKRIAVVGCGGLGGHIIELMARLGIGHITCVDGDVFDESNLNRQLLSEEALLGTPKAQAAVERIRRINSHISCQGIHQFLTEENASRILDGCDLVFDALDNVESRRTLEKACEDLQIPYIHGAIAGWMAQAAVCMPGQKLTQLLYPEGVILKDKSVLSLTPALCASMQTALGVKLLCGRKVETGKLYFFDLLHQDFETIPLG